jgi:hypothetical protein
VNELEVLRDVFVLFCFALFCFFSFLTFLVQLSFVASSTPSPLFSRVSAPNCRRGGRIARFRRFAILFFGSFLEARFSSSNSATRSAYARVMDQYARDDPILQGQK